MDVSVRRKFCNVRLCLGLRGFTPGLCSSLPLQHGFPAFLPTGPAREKRYEIGPLLASRSAPGLLRGHRPCG